MPKRQFEFSPSVQLILINLPTIRKVQKILDEETVTAEVKQFLKYLAVRLPEEVPEVRAWQSDLSSETLYLFPGKSWRVVKDDHIAVCISLGQCTEPAFYSDEDDPFYVPQWKHLDSFTNHLKELRIPDFEHIGNRNDVYDENYPLWSYVYLAPLVKQSTLDTDGLEKGIVGRVRKLVAKEEKITNFISTLRQNGV